MHCETVLCQTGIKTHVICIYCHKVKNPGRHTHKLLIIINHAAYPFPLILVHLKRNNNGKHFKQYA